jgi:hypothetical protein
MTRLAGLAFAIAFLLFPVNSQNEQFSKYRRVGGWASRQTELSTLSVPLDREETSKKGAVSLQGNAQILG